MLCGGFINDAYLEGNDKIYTSGKYIFSKRKVFILIMFYNGIIDHLPWRW